MPQSSVLARALARSSTLEGALVGRRLSTSFSQRWGLSNGDNVQRTERDLKDLFPREAWNRLHLQIIFYGREFCTARGCDGRICPMCRELYPNRRKPVITRKA